MILSAFEPFKDQYAYGLELYSLGQATKRLKAQSEAFAEAIEQKRGIASIKDAQSIEADFLRLRASAGALSGRHEAE
jgi:hypothetical protein